jgi:hypothetical protein
VCSELAAALSGPPTNRRKWIPFKLALTYVLAILLYTLPCMFLWAAWKRETRTTLGESRPPWRASCLKAGFIVAASATALSLTFLFSYLRNGGGIHGSSATPGLWTTLGPISAAALVSSLLLAAIGKSKGNLLLIGWLLGVFVVEYIVFPVAFD